jgi:hypothetical protein
VARNGPARRATTADRLKGLQLMRQRRRGRGTPAAIAAVLALGGSAGTIAGCGGGDDGTPDHGPAATTTFVGKLDGSRAFVALAVRDGKVRAYVCDGRHLGRWLNGRVADRSVAAAGAAGSRLNASVHGAAANGSVTLDGGHPQHFAAVAAHGGAGLFRGSGHGYTGGWIVLADGAQRGVFTTKTTSFSAPLLTSQAITDGRIAITPIPIPGATPLPIPLHVAPGGGLGV